MIQAHYQGRDGIVSDCGVSFRMRANGTSVLPAFCRRLIAQGRDPSTLIRVFREGTKVWAKDLPLAYWAELTVSETRRTRPSFRAYKPFAHTLLK